MGPRRAPPRRGEGTPGARGAAGVPILLLAVADYRLLLRDLVQAERLLSVARVAAGHQEAPYRAKRLRVEARAGVGQGGS